MSETKTHWRKIVESEYLSGADLDDGQGNFIPIIVTIRSASQEMLVDPGTKKQESCLLLKFQEAKYKPMICNATNAKAISKALNSEYIQDWSGKQITIGTEKVKAFGELWNALRVRSVAPKSATSPVQTQTTIACTDCKQPIPDHEGAPARHIAASTNQKYGRPLCYECAQIAKAAMEAPKTEEQPDAE